MTRLLRIGYWRSTTEPHWPDPGAFIDKTWPEDLRAAVVVHLRDARPLEVASGSSWCRFWCEGFGAHGLGTAELSDGRFVWPAGLAHYVERHFVRLPEDFLCSVGKPPEPFPPPIDIPTCFDDQWWRAQPGFGSSHPTFSAPARFGQVFAFPTRAPATPQLLSELRRCPELQNRSILEIDATLQATDRFPLICNV